MIYYIKVNNIKELNRLDPEPWKILTYELDHMPNFFKIENGEVILVGQTEQYQTPEINNIIVRPYICHGFILRDLEDTRTFEECYGKNDFLSVDEYLLLKELL